MSTHQKAHLLIFAIFFLFFVPFLGNVYLFDWDEINFAECAREMIVTGDYLNVQINFEAFWEKPPLFIWMQVLSMKLFGIGEFAARFPNAVCGLISLLVLYSIGKKIKNEQLGIIWVLTYSASILPFFYFKSGIIDPWFNLFILLSFWRFIVYTSGEKKLLNAALSSAFIGLAVLTKGPVALLIFGASVFVFLIFKRFKIGLTVKDLLVFTISFLLIGGSWFFVQIMNGQSQTVYDFIIYQIRLFQTKDAGHGGFMLYHFVILLVGVFPASVFALRGFQRNKNLKNLPDFQAQMLLAMKILFWVVLILFTIVKTKIVHYSSLCYFPLTFIAAFEIDKIVNREKNINRFEKIFLVAMSSIYILLVFAISQLGKFAPLLVEKLKEKDPFAAGNLSATLHWTGWEITSPLVLFMGIILAFTWLKKDKIQHFFGALVLSFILFTSLLLYLIAPKIEGVSQNAALEFYKEKSTEKCTVNTLRFKSYAHLFYFNKKQPTDTLSENKTFQLTGDIQKTAYFVSKANHKEKVLTENPLLKVYREKNGWVFYKREVESN